MPEPSSQTPPPGATPPEATVQLGPDAAELLDQLGGMSRREQVALLQADQHRRWQRGERPRVEDYLQRFPTLRADVEAVLDLVYGEVLLRQDAGERPQLDEYLERFPEYAEQLRRQFSVDRALQAGLLGDAVAATPPGTDGALDDSVPAETPGRAAGESTLPASRPPLPVPDVALPQVVGYRILGVLGRGGMGVVYRAEQVGLKRVVALKMILAGAHAGPEQMARFRTEAEAVARLQHPNIVQIYEVGEQDGLPFFSLEFVEGGSLEKRLGRAPQPARATAELTEVLARAIQAAHERGIIHRDLKPANVLLTAGGVPKVTDFGLAKQVDSEAGQTQEGMVMGTPSYMAPEQALGLVREVGPSADVYALGALLYELLTGRPPFQGATSLETLQMVLFEEPVPVRRLQPRCPRDLETVCLKCLQKPARKRYATAADLADDLRRFLNNEPIRARPVGRVERGLKWVRRHPAWAALWAVGAAACLALLAGGALWYHARAQAEVDQARAVAAEARAETAEARDAQREAEKEAHLGRQRTAVQQCLLAGSEAQARGDVAEARKQAEQAQTLVRDEPALADLREPVGRLVAEVERREVVRRDYDRLLAGRDEALFHLNRQLFTGLDQGESLEKARQEAEEALRPFTGSPDPRQPLVLDELYSPPQKAEITEGCYELLLIRAEATARPVPGQQAAEQRDRAGQALRLLDRADALVPGTRAVHRRRERYLARLGDDAGARREHNLAAAEGPTTPLDSFLVGYDAVEDGRPQEAIIHFDRAVRNRADLFWAYFFRALAYQQVQQPADARADLTVCIARRPDFIWSYLLRGFLHGEVGAQAPAAAAKASAFQSAEADLDRAETLHPDAAARYVLLVNRGVLRVRQQRYPDAVAVLREAIRLDPAQPQAHANLAEAYRKQGQADAALAELGEAIARSAPRASGPGQAALYRTRARLQLQRQDLDAALHDLQDAARKDGEALRAAPPGSASDLAGDHLEQALILYRERHYVEAVRECEEALRLRPELVVAHRLAGLALVQLGRYADALAAFDRYAEKGAPVADVFRARAQVHVELGEAAAAVQDYSRALDLKPHDAALHAARGWAYLASDAPRLALPDFQEAVRLDPGNADAYGGRGYARVKLAQSAGALAQAAADADEARRRQPGDPTTLLHVARVYAQAVGRLDADAFPGAAQAAEARALYQDRAVALLRDALEHTPRGRQPGVWQQIEKDFFLGPVRRGSAYRRLAVEYGRAAADKRTAQP